MYSFPVLSLEEALSCIPPPITYSPKCTKSKTTTNVSGDSPANVELWGDFFEEVNRFRFDQQPKFERPQFIKNKVVLNEEDVRVAIDVNMNLRDQTAYIQGVLLTLPAYQISTVISWVH
jgi:hypothetical protein